MTDRRTDGQTDVDSKVRSNEVRCAQKLDISLSCKYHLLSWLIRKAKEGIRRLNERMGALQRYQRTWASSCTHSESDIEHIDTADDNKRVFTKSLV